MLKGEIFVPMKFPHTWMKSTETRQCCKRDIFGMVEWLPTMGIKMSCTLNHLAHKSFSSQNFYALYLLNNLNLNQGHFGWDSLTKLRVPFRVTLAGRYKLPWKFVKKSEALRSFLHEPHSQPLNFFLASEGRKRFPDSVRYGGAFSTRKFMVWHLFVQ